MAAVGEKQMAIDTAVRTPSARPDFIRDEHLVTDHERPAPRGNEHHAGDHLSELGVGCQGRVSVLVLEVVCLREGSPAGHG
jgi:hypothetical protein